ncbi:MAG: SAM-dependent methyltransferase [Desulfobacteraceae bacterium 4484_190.2]|nr:MAG: SAM-dependent methyltransferase [Desulfobacteraceae bacterium 4484_190.2]
MAKTSIFQKHFIQYEKWFTENRWVYEAELRAVKALIPEKGKGIEIGVGTGRFAQPLGVKIGVEPSGRMKKIAQKRGIQVLDGVAEELPFSNSEFDFALMVTTVCFVDDIDKSLQEAYRILSQDGFLIIGLVDRNSSVGQIYLNHQNESVFYKDATFFSVDEIIEIMTQIGFRDFDFRQTIFKTLSETTENEPVKHGYGKGSFVVIRATKPGKVTKVGKS